MTRDTSMPTHRALAVLGLQAGASREQVKAAYRAAVKRTHPDAGGTAAAFIEAKRAFDSLVSGGTGRAAEQPKPAPSGATFDEYAEYLKTILREMSRGVGLGAGFYGRTYTRATGPVPPPRPRQQYTAKHGWTVIIDDPIEDEGGKKP